ncbi:MAG: glycosyltransferase [Rickettsiales bacterium]|nr:glycosyltransferase [Rickettsiales bacterium]
MKTALLGSLLVKHSLIEQEQLDQALRLQAISGERLGDILIAEGSVNYLNLYRAIAEHYGLAFVNLLKTPPDPDLLKQADPNVCLKLRAIPWRQRDEQIIIATTELSDAVISWAQSTFGHRISYVITSPFDIRRTIEQSFGNALEEESRLLLWQQFPLASARTSMAANWRWLLIGLAATTLILSSTFPKLSLVSIGIICHAAYFLNTLFKCQIFAWGQRATVAQFHPPVPEAELPLYTILVPMYREAESVDGLLRNLYDLDYPRAKLDIKLVLEADDKETLQAAQSCKPHYNFDIIRVPPSQPRTKPKACNYALRFARGEYITIFDADDRPEPKQLKKAIAAFRALPEDVVCVQARLNYYNASENWLTRFFSLEYAMLFHVMLKGFERLGIPIPLGGTSNHIRLSTLRELGEWDPYNVTEDADLGIRIASRGWKTAMIDSYTLEECPISIIPWIKQRSRWIKGYMQTWLVHMRRPITMYRTLGLKGFIGIQCTFGLSCFAFVSAPLVWLIMGLWAAELITLENTPFPLWLIWAGVINLAIHVLSHWYFTSYCWRLYRSDQANMAMAVACYPLYLFLHSVASYKALWQLIVKPYFWEKTRHGVTHLTTSIATETATKINQAA